MRRWPLALTIVAACAAGLGSTHVEWLPVAAAQPAPRPNAGQPNAGQPNARQRRPARRRPVDPRTRTVDTPGITASVSIGLGGKRDSTLPTPLLLRVRNGLTTPVNGRWEIESYQAHPFGPTLRTITEDVFVAPGAEHMVRMARAIGPGRLSVRLRAGGRLLWQRYFEMDDSGEKSSYLAADHLNLLAIQVPQHRTNFAITRKPRPVPKEQPKDKNGIPIIDTDTRLHPFGERPVWTSRIVPEELPDSAPPLCAYHAILVVPENAVFPKLAASQREALARYLYLGGTVVLPAEAEDLRNALAAAMPETLRPSALRPGPVSSLKVLPVGAGRLVRMPSTDFRDAAALKRLTLLIESGREPYFPRYVTADPYPSGLLMPNAATSLGLVGGLFGLYLLLTGPFLLLFLRRLKKRVIRIYVAAVVGVFCLLSALLGPTLDRHPGDAASLTVTELTPDGGIQWGMLTLTSAGGRGQQVALAGNAASGRVLPERGLVRGWYREIYYEYGESGARGYNLPFDSRPPQRELDVPVAPWGSRLVLATALAPELKPLPVRVSFDSRSNTIHASVHNTLPWKLKRARVVVMGFARHWRSWRDAMVGGPHYVNITIRGRIEPGAHGAGAAPRDAASDYHRHSQHEVGQAMNWMPELNRRGAPWGYLIAEIDDGKNPGTLGLREGAPFVMGRQTHLVVQAIHPAALPELEEMFPDVQPTPDEVRWRQPR